MRPWSTQRPDCPLQGPYNKSSGCFAVDPTRGVLSGLGGGGGRAILAFLGFGPTHQGFVCQTGGGGGRIALEGNEPQRRPQKRLDRRLEVVANAVQGGYNRQGDSSRA